MSNALLLSAFRKLLRDSDWVTIDPHRFCVDGTTADLTDAEEKAVDEHMRRLGR